MSLDPHSTSLVWPLILPILGAFGVQALGRWPDARDAWTVVIGLATFGSVVPLIGPVSAGEHPSLGLPGWMPGLGMGFEVEPLGLLFALIASGLWVATSIYGFGYMRGHHEPNQTRFFTCFAVAISATLGIAFAGDLVTLFFFYEILTFSTYPLVTHHGNEASIKAGRLYLGILVSTSILFFLLAIIWTSELAGTLHFRRGGVLEGQVEGGEAI
ncbi:MAG: proton-conducting transporter transmembrane domain-containing protein, partial [bacterium]